MVLNKFQPADDFAWGDLRGCMLDQVLSCIIMSRKYGIYVEFKGRGLYQAGFYLMLCFPNRNGNKWLCHWTGVETNGCAIKFVAPGRESVNTTLEWTFLHFQLVDAAFPSCFYCLGPVKKTFQWRKRDQGTFSKSALPPTKPFNLPAHFPYSMTLLNVICSFPAVKLFPLPSFPLWVSSLLSWPFFLCEPSLLLLLLLQLLHWGWCLLSELSGRS